MGLAIYFEIFQILIHIFCRFWQLWWRGSSDTWALGYSGMYQLPRVCRNLCRVGYSGSWLRFARVLALEPVRVLEYWHGVLARSTRRHGLRINHQKKKNRIEQLFQHSNFLIFFRDWISGTRILRYSWVLCRRRVGYTGNFFLLGYG